MFEEKFDPEQLKGQFRKNHGEILKQARIIAKVSLESKVDMKEADYLKTFNPGLMEVILEWSKGAGFAQIWYVARLDATKDICN